MQIIIEDSLEPVPFSLKKKRSIHKICLKENGESKWYRPDREAEDSFYNQNYKYKQHLKKLITKTHGLHEGCVLWKRPSPVYFRAQVYFPKKANFCYKPDIDNLLKTFLDAGTKMIYEDDCQVVDIRIEKHQTCGEEWEVHLVYSENPLT